MRLYAALGVNLWATLVAVPGLYASSSPWPWLVPLLAVAIACLRPRDALLLGVVPAALALAAALQPEASAMLSRPFPLALASAGFVAYLWAAARLLQARSLPAAQPTVPLHDVRRLPPRPRMRTILLAWAVVAPLVLLHAAVLRDGAASDLAAHFPERPAAGALAVCAIAALWVGLVVIYGSAALGAPDQLRRTRGELFALRQTVRRARPSVAFYLAVAAALGGMAVLVVLRYRG